MKSNVKLKCLHAGVTLIELMIAMTIGLLIVSAVGAVYIGNKQTYTSSEVVARLQDEARYATMQIRASVQQAGYFGRLENPILINGRFGSGSALPTYTWDCAAGWYMNLTVIVAAPDTSGGNPFASTCLHGSSIAREFKPDTDILVIRRAASKAVDHTVTKQRPTHADNHGYVYLRADVSHGEIYIANATENPEGYDEESREDRRLVTEMFYVTPNHLKTGSDADEIPTLRRLYLSKYGSTPSLQSDRVARYVEDFKVQFGEDMDGDGFADRFTNPATASPDRTVSVRIWLLFRSDIREADHQSPATFTLADSTYTIPAGTENFRRLLVNQTYTLRNR